MKTPPVVIPTDSASAEADALLVGYAQESAMIAMNLP